MNPSPPATEPAPAASLPPRLGLYTATMIVMGSMIGSGIFKKPAAMAEDLPAALPLLAVWVLGGLITLCGALSNAEVAGMMPQVGGQYVFFRRIYNDFVGYLYGWAIFAVIQSGSIASIAYVFAEYLGFFLPLPRLSPELEAWGFSLWGVIQVTPLHNLGVKLVTVGCIALLTAINIRGVVLGGAVQNIFTTGKLLAIAAVVLLAFTAGQGDLAQLTAQELPAGAGSWQLLGGMGAALAGAFWAYDGWNNITYIAGEVRQPRRNIPRALMLGTAAVLGVYLLTNLAYLYLLPLSAMAGSKLVAADAMTRVLGPLGGALISGMVMLSTFGSTNGSILASARVYYAMAQDGLFFSALGRSHPRYQTPATSLLVQGIWAALLVFSGTFDQLTDMLIFVAWIFYALGALGVFVLRWREPDTPRPYRVWGYPLVPALFVAFAGAFVGVTLSQSPRSSLLGLLLVALGLPLYLYFGRRQPR